MPSTDDQAFIADELRREKDGAQIAHSLDDQKFIEQELRRAAAPAGTIDESGALDEPSWDFSRELIDAVTDGAFARTGGKAREKAQKAWQTKHGGQATTAQLLGKVVPSVVLSGLLGQGELGLARLASIPEVGEFLTGTGEGNALMRGLSQSAWGAQQGALSAGYDRAMGAPDSITGGATVGALAGPVTSRLLTGSITPRTREIARNWLAQGQPLRTSQMAGSPIIARAFSKLFGLDHGDLPKLTKSLMATTGSDAEELTERSVNEAKQGILTRLNTALGPNWQSRAQSTFTQQEREAFAQAQQQMANLQIIDKMRTPQSEVSGVVDPRTVLRRIQSKNAAPSDDLQQLGLGTQAFIQPAGKSLLERHPVATVGAAVGGDSIAHEVWPHVAPFVTDPMTLGAAGVLGTVGPLLNSGAYRNTLLRGATPDLLLPLLQGRYGNELSGVLNPIGTANAGMHGDQSDWEQIIRDKAGAKGIDPDIAVRVARTEGLGDSYAGDQGSSFGPFQLHYGGMASGGNAVSGLGDLFTKETGLHASDPRTVPAQIDFALDYAKSHGWSSWHGWKGDPNAGLNERTSVTVPMRAADDQQSNDLTGSQ